MNGVIAGVLCSAVFTLACLLAYAYRHPQQTPVQTSAVVGQGEVDELTQAAYDEGYINGFEDCKGGLGMHPDIVARSGLADTEQVEAYISALPDRSIIDGQENSPVEPSDG